MNPTTPKVVSASSFNVEGCDALVLVADFTSSKTTLPDGIKTAVDAALALDQGVTSSACVIACAGCPGGRLVLAPTGPLARDYDDARLIEEAAHAGCVRAQRAGVRTPALMTIVPAGLPRPERYEKAAQVALLGALFSCFSPLEVRELDSYKGHPFDAIHAVNLSEEDIKAVIAIETGRAVARDICGSDPERMAPLRVAEYVSKLFEGTGVTVNAVTDRPTLEKEYPLLSAVARCSQQVDRHCPAKIDLVYQGSGPIEKTLYMVGKGITYDTGGADVKAGGIMAGMHRDKGGAAAICGFVRTLSLLQPKNLKVVAKLAMVRNSIGADCYVADEIITSRAGVRVRVGNTDAEGRMVMADVLCEAKEQALEDAHSPALFTVATLTGHAVRAYGPYSAVMCNGPAQVEEIEKKVFAAGYTWGDPVEISTVRREDYKIIDSKFPTEDVVQCNSLPSSATPRGHQFPAAFMGVASGVDKHGLDSDKPLPYTHMDIAGSTKMWPQHVTGAPIAALTGAYVLQ